MKHNTMKSTISAIAAALVLTGGAFAAPAAIEAAKDQCVIGEQADGYLGVVDGAVADAGLRREMQSINQQRKAAYANLAERNGVSIEQAAALTAERLMNGAPSGHCIQLQDGEWVKKP